MNTALIDLFRCPEAFLNFDLIAPLSADPGYFRFGSDAICYGRSSSGYRASLADGALYDVFADVTANGSRMHLPFDPTEVIDNLRCEQYAKHLQGGKWKRSLRNAYYLLRPLMHLQVRKQIQRAHLKSWQNLSFPRWPVDTTVENICEQVLLLSMRAQGIDRVPFIWFWPDGAQGGVSITHDVETGKGMSFCNDLMDLDDSFGIKSAFQIVPEGRYKVSDAFLRSIRSRGFEVNIQDLNHDGRLFEDHAEFFRRARRINEYAKAYDAVGFRAAVLYRNVEWYDMLQFSFDMSVPNVAHLDPQRGGCCTVMPYFVGKMLELPLTTTQDYMLFHLLNDYSLDLWKSQTEIILGKNGLATFLVHPDYLREKKARDSYLDLLTFLRQLQQSAKLWFALPREIDQWWRARSQMQLVSHNGNWQIRGLGAERAKLAFARLVEDRIEYEVTT